jgi:hypothetical protein
MRGKNIAISVELPWWDGHGESERDATASSRSEYNVDVVNVI